MESGKALGGGDDGMVEPPGEISVCVIWVGSGLFGWRRDAISSDSNVFSLDFEVDFGVLRFFGLLGLHNSLSIINARFCTLAAVAESDDNEEEDDDRAAPAVLPSRRRRANEQIERRR